MKLLLQLFGTFAKIGLFTFGGGYAMIALIERACVENKGWITHDEMMEIAVIAESTPGSIAVNCATYVGNKQKGFLGAAAATAGVVLPSFCIIYAVSVFLNRFLEIAWVANAFRGVKLAVGLLILDAAIRMLRNMPKKPLPISILSCGCAAMLAIDYFSLRISTVVLMLAAGAVSLLVYTVKTRRKAGGDP